MADASPRADLRVEVSLSPGAVVTHDAAHEGHAEAPEGRLLSEPPLEPA